MYLKHHYPSIGSVPTGFLVASLALSRKYRGEAVYDLEKNVRTVGSISLTLYIVFLYNDWWDAV